MQGSLFGDSSVDEGIGSVEEGCRQAEIDWIVGVDEAGRGPLAGPVYAAAVAMDVGALEADWIALLDDSKKLDEAAREEAFDQIRAQSVAFDIQDNGPEIIDEVNILEATRLAMKTAVEGVCAQLETPPDCVFIDGNVQIDIEQRQRTVVKGDGRSYAIAAASILAKVARDRFMLQCHERWPAYNFASNKGYPTREHRDAIEENGPCPIHRRSFSGV